MTMEVTTSSMAKKCGHNGASADIYVSSQRMLIIQIMVEEHGGTTAFIVDSSMEGFSVGKKEDKLGIRSSDTCTLLLEDCKVPVENVLKEAGKGFPIAMNALDNSRIGIAAQALGIAQGAYESALNYAHQREAFGKPIAHHQSIGNYLADMATQTEAPDTWSTRQHGQNNDTTKRMDLGIQWKLAWRSCLLAIPQCGSREGCTSSRGYGYTTDFPVERFFRDAKITQIYEGTQEVQRIVINRSIAPE